MKHALRIKWERMNGSHLTLPHFEKKKKILSADLSLQSTRVKKIFKKVLKYVCTLYLYLFTCEYLGNVGNSSGKALIFIRKRQRKLVLTWLGSLVPTRPRDSAILLFVLPDLLWNASDVRKTLQPTFCAPKLIIVKFLNALGKTEYVN